jgi:release factor glutamine methyltransferase
MAPTGKTAAMDVTAVVDRLRAAGCVFAEDEARLLVAAAGTPDRLAAMVSERVAGVPLEYVLGWAEFCGLRIGLLRGVFVPRRRTELLVREAIVVCPPDAVVVDVCCGSGAVGAAMRAGTGAAMRAGTTAIEVHAADIDPTAVRCARANLAGAAVYEGDLFGPLPERLRGRVDVIVANAPYVPSDAFELLPPEAREHEPRSALDGGHDGLEIVRRIVTAAPAWLGPGGHLLVETSAAQATALAGAFIHGGLSARVAADPELNATVVIGRLSGG